MPSGYHIRLFDIEADTMIINHIFAYSFSHELNYLGTGFVACICLILNICSAGSCAERDRKCDVTYVL